MNNTGDLIIIENEHLQVQMHNPINRSEKHFSTRYNHCGYIEQIYDKVNNKILLGTPTTEWNSFSGNGFPDEFEMPIGYDEAHIGECFLKIGVGQQEKNSLCLYKNRDKHLIKKLADIKVYQKKNAIEFIATDSLNGYSYLYKKIIELKNDVISIRHELKNTGNKYFKTLWYSHAFIPHMASNSCLSLVIPADYKLLERMSNSNLRINPISQDYISYSFIVNDETLNGCCFNWTTDSVENKQTLSNFDNEIYTSLGNYKLDELQVFINDKIISVEPKHFIELSAGESRKWETSYLFR